MAPMVLAVDPERGPHRQRILSLAQDGFDVKLTDQGAEARAMVEVSQPDIVLVDPSVPDVDGIDLCRWLRTFPGAPIIALSTDASERAQLALFEAGVDDVVLKPISKRLLLARIRVQLRHERHRERAAGEVVTVGNLRIDTAALEAEVAGRRLLLSHRQFAMLRLLVHNVGSTVPSAMIARVLGRHDEGADPRTVRNAISKLRAALGHGPGTPEIVRQPTGGYRLLVP